ncbi:MAG: DUF4010 domain-containing protein [Aliidongia sp.]
MMLLNPLFTQFLLVLGLGFFFGLAFEEFHGRNGQTRPGGIRTFPLLALIAASLYQLDPVRLLPLCVGLAVLGLWLAIYYRRHLIETDEEGRPNVGLVVPVCNLLAYLIGPMALSQPPWVAVGATVAAVLLLTARERLHGWARRIELSEIVTAGKFLLLTGLIMPLLPDVPVTTLTDITPHQIWLAVLAVCTVSYASYLLQRYVAPQGGMLGTAVLGGLYSSTATTVVLARRAAGTPASVRQAQSGIIVATAIMYLRLLIIMALFNWSLAVLLAPPLLALAGLAAAMAVAVYWRSGAKPSEAEEKPLANPLELTAALVFAVLFVAVTLLSAWVKGAFGAAGIYALAAIVGVADIDPFVLSIAEGGAAQLPLPAAVMAILIASSSNNLLKAAYTIGFAGWRTSLVPAGALGLLAVCGGGAALWLMPQ